MIDVVSLERELTAFFGGIVGLSVDSGIFRGIMPETATDAVSVRINDDSGAFLDTPKYSVQILGRFAERDDALAFLALLRSKFPMFGRSSGSFRFPSIVPQDASVDPYSLAVRGNTMHFVSFNLVVRVLTASA